MSRVAILFVILLALLGAAWVAQDPIRLDALQAHATSALTTLQTRWHAFAPDVLQQRPPTPTLAIAVAASLALAVLLRVVRPIQRLRDWVRARQAGRVTVRQFAGRSWWNLDPEPLAAAVYPDSHSLEWAVEVDAPDWKDVQPPDLLLHLVPPDGSTRVELVARAHPMARHRYLAEFALSDLSTLRSHVGEWTATLLLQQTAREPRVLATQPLPVFNEPLLLADLQCGEFGISTSSGAVPEPSGLLLCEHRESLIVHAIVRTTRCDARALPAVQARVSLARIDGTDSTYVQVPLEFRYNAASVSHAVLAFPHVNGHRAAGRWMLRLLVGDRVLAEQKLGVATRSQMSRELQLQAIHVVGLDAAGRRAQPVGDLLVQSSAVAVRSLALTARFRTAAPTPNLAYRVGFAVLLGEQVLLHGEQDVVFDQWEQDVIAGEWTPPRDVPGGLELAVVVTVDGEPRGERTLQMINDQLRVTDAQGQLVHTRAGPDAFVDAEYASVLGSAQSRPL